MSEEFTPALPITPPYDAQRQNNFPTTGDQLDLLWHDIDAGLLGEPAKTGSWYLAVKAVKDEFPKQ
jgi:hypothetical protein